MRSPPTIVQTSLCAQVGSQDVKAAGLLKYLSGAVANHHESQVPNACFLHCADAKAQTLHAFLGSGVRMQPQQQQGEAADGKAAEQDWRQQGMQGPAVSAAVAAAAAAPAPRRRMGAPAGGGPGAFDFMPTPMEIAGAAAGTAGSAQPPANPQQQQMAAQFVVPVRQQRNSSIRSGLSSVQALLSQAESRPHSGGRSGAPWLSVFCVLNQVLVSAQGQTHLTDAVILRLLGACCQACHLVACLGLCASSCGAHMHVFCLICQSGRSGRWDGSCPICHLLTNRTVQEAPFHGCTGPLSISQGGSLGKVHKAGPGVPATSQEVRLLHYPAFVCFAVLYRLLNTVNVWLCDTTSL